jgi:hypothetical protein
VCGYHAHLPLDCCRHILRPGPAQARGHSGAGTQDGARNRRRESKRPRGVLLAERIASLWVLVEAQEALLSATYRRGQKKPVGPAFVIQMYKIQESANRRYLAAIKALAQVRKLQANTPAVQYNTQINVS